jgi:hypothetical protein
MQSRYVQSPSGIRYFYDTTSMHESIVATMALADFESAPHGQLTYTVCGQCFTYQTLPTTASAWSGDTIRLKFGVNAWMELEGVYAGDSIAGSMSITYVSSTQTKHWGRFVARRIP